MLIEAFKELIRDFQLMLRHGGFISTKQESEPNIKTVAKAVACINL